MELIVVISVAVVLTGLMMPAMRNLRENAHRVICMSNMSQLGQGFMMYGGDHDDRLPYSAVLRIDGMPQELMSSWRVGLNGSDWDGLGQLFSMSYCGAPQCFYCPSHHGDHPLERYIDQWFNPDPEEPIYTNYHYAGDVEWMVKSRRRTLLDGYWLVLATDGLRTMDDFNHTTGMNLLRGDGSVRWRDDRRDIRSRLPRPGLNDSDDQSGYQNLWDEMSKN